MQIPLILHQTYKSGRLPRRLAELQSSWRRHNPHWDYRFWSDAAMEEFIAEHYADFLPVFRNYPQHIMRVDAFRYFLLYHYGGIYADLDFECLRPMDELLAGKDILLIPEPPLHLDKLKPKVRNLTYIVSNALMASAPKHPFWLAVTRRLQENRATGEVLDLTGPFMLTAVHHEFSPQLPLAPAEQFDSITSDDTGKIAKARTEQFDTAAGDDLADAGQTRAAQFDSAASDDSGKTTSAGAAQFDSAASDDSGKTTSAGAAQPYACHHWLGSWWKHNVLLDTALSSARAIKGALASILSFEQRLQHYISKLAEQQGQQGLYGKLVQVDRGRVKQARVRDYDFAYAEKLLARDNLPKVSAVMLCTAESSPVPQAAQAMQATGQQAANTTEPAVATLDAAARALRAVECFRQQTYPNKELILLDDGEGGLLPQLQQLGDLAKQGIIYHRLKQPSPATIADLARGDYLCWWDSNFLYYKQRLAYQLAACLKDRADANFLLRQLFLSDDAGALGISEHKLWPNSILASRDKFLAFIKRLNLRPADDTAAAAMLDRAAQRAINRTAGRTKLAVLDLPGLSIYNPPAISDDLYRRASRLYFLQADRREMLRTLGDDYPHLARL